MDLITIIPMEIHMSLILIIIVLFVMFFSMVGILIWGYMSDEKIDKDYYNAVYNGSNSRIDKQYTDKINELSNKIDTLMNEKRGDNDIIDCKYTMRRL